jgi:hypothetical protein
MSPQADYIVANGTGAAVRSDLNGQLAAIVSNNSGATEPATMYAYQWWADTTTGLLKLRNSANSAWISLRELDGTLTIEDGTAAAPGLAFTDDLNTGLFRVGADEVAISTGGTSRLAVSTTAVSSTLAVDVPLGAVGTPSLTFTGDLNTGIWSPAADTIAFSEGGVEAMRIDSSSRLLVGASSSRDVGTYGYEAKTQIEGTSSVVAGLTLTGNRNDSLGPYFVLGRSRGTTAGSSTVVQNNDELGTIQFCGADGTDLVTAGALIRAEVDGTPGANDMPGRIVLATTADGASSPTERMRITQSGMTKISNNGGSGATRYSNTTNHVIHQSVTSQWALAVEQSASSTPYGIVIEYPNVTPNNTDSPFLHCTDSSALRASIRSNGGLANYSGNNVNLSDINTKKDISPAAGTWDCIKEWEIVNYRYKDQPDDTDLNMGVIAQQVAESCPEVITVFEEAKDDQPEKLGVKEQQMYWMAIKALQEAQVRIEQLEAKVVALESA